MSGLFFPLSQTVICKLCLGSSADDVRYTNCSWNSGLTVFHLTVVSCFEFLFCGHRTLKSKMKIKKISNCDLTRKLASANYCNIVRYTNCSWNSGLTVFHLTVVSCLEFLFFGHRTLKSKMKENKKTIVIWRDNWQALLQYWLWSFKLRDTKLVIFVAENEHVQRKFLSFKMQNQKIWTQ